MGINSFVATLLKWLVTEGESKNNKMYVFVMSFEDDYKDWQLMKFL